MEKNGKKAPTMVPQFLIPEIDFDISLFDEKNRQINVTLIYKSICFKFCQFYFDLEFCNFEKKIPPMRNADLRFGIPADCTVTIFLKNSNIWRWSEEFYAITLKDKNSMEFYKKYEFNNKDQTVSFKAKKRDGAQEDDYFTMNIEVFQKRSKKQWLPISIDPWVENPRPNTRN
jgi:hypothetical protein